MKMSLRAVCKAKKLRVLALLAIATIGFGLQAHSQCSTPANAIVAENCLRGSDASEWDINGQAGGDLTIQGFATDISVNRGGTIFFKINTPASGYTIDIYRMGYYGGKGARKVVSINPSVALPQSQPACLGDTSTGLTDCGNWAVSASWQVPSTATSGIYFAHLTRNDTGGDSHIVFIVRDDSSQSDILYQTSDLSWQAYNYYGNGSLYGAGQPTFGLASRSFAVSYNRPVLTRGFSAESATWVFGAEFAMVQWLEANGYNVSYTTGVDSARNGSLILNHKVFMDSGHDEYVSAEARANITAARDAGVNLAFFSGNEFFWKTRWVNSIDGSNTPFRTIVCYKETLAFAKLDPADPPTWTGTWRDPTFSPPADGGQPENALTGTLFKVNGPGDDSPGTLTIKVPQADGQMRFWRNTPAATLAAGATYSLVAGSLGYEWDVDADNGFRPAGAFHLSTSTYPMTSDLLLDFGGTYGAGTATHNLMMYRAPSGALVFGAGTIDWAYGLNSNHDSPFMQSPPTNLAMQQATVNLFADMGVQPANLQSGLSAATQSTDTVAPQSTILSPVTGASLNTGTTVTVSGTARDTGGAVGGVEFSGDGGATWHPATGRGSWSYAWTPRVAGQVTLLSRAVDDSGNLETPTNGVVLSVSPQNCPCTVFGSTTPTAVDSGDGGAIEVGMKFRPDANGSIVGVRFYKSKANTGVHVGHVWSEAGQLLGSATFSGESASGWQQVNFATPIAATANTTYVVSYFAPVGHYSADAFYFGQAGVDNPPLHALADGVDGGNGVYLYSSGGGFPTSPFNATNYWADVIFASSNTYSIAGTVSGAGGAGATVTLSGAESLSTATDASGNYTFAGVVSGSYTVAVSNPGVSFSPASQAVNLTYSAVTGVNFTATVLNPLSISGTITGGAGASVTLAGAATGTVIADSSGNYSFTGLLGGSYTVTPAKPTLIFNPSTQAISLSGSNATGVNFQAQVCNCISLWQPSDTPAVIDSGDGAAVELGVRFTVDSSASLTGLRFYKASTNVGTHVGHLWSAAGQLLGTVTFPGETSSGWQQGYFSTPVQVNAGTSYIASYFAPQGHYSLTSGYFASSGTDRPPLHAPQDGVGGSNGVFVYSSTGGFPTGSYNSTNYWVDVLYSAQPHNLSGTITGTGAAGATVTLSGTGQAVSTTTDANGNFAFPGVLGGSYTVVPSSPGYIFVPATQSVAVSQTDVTGVNFTIPSICPCGTVWPLSTTPATSDAGDAQPVELGVKVRADADGYVLGVRFYKSPANTGVHLGNLWAGSAGSAGSPAGSLLSTAAFANESASGWQQVLFANPVPVLANTTYIASYFAPTGHYAADSGFFASNGVDSPPLHALQTGTDGANGVYSYGSSSGLPTSSFNAANYWVDVIYAATATHSIGGNVSGPGASGATISLGGGATATTTSDANGNYSFSQVPDGSYTVSISASGYKYTPATQAVSLSGAHNLGVNFASSVIGFPVSGTVSGAPGISVTLSGATTQTTTADSSGAYQFPLVPNGSYTVTPSAGAYTVVPASQSVTVNGAAVTGVNFAATVNVFSISGTISGGSGATVALSGSSSASTVADSTGKYTFTGVSAGNYVVTPSIGGGLVFNPANLSVALSNANVSGANFSVPQVCPCNTIWPGSALPAAVDGGNTASVEVGVKFRADADAYITGVRFYKSVANTGTHLGRIWSSAGVLLGTATFVGESSSGWQQVFFSTSIPVKANTTYIASYFAPNGHNSADPGYFASAATDAPPLHALQDGVDGFNGVYLLSANGGFPVTSSAGTAVNYWVDVIYDPTTTYTISGTVAGAGGPGATVALSGASTATTVSDANGNFSFNGLPNGSYTVAPQVTGFSYSPASQSVTIASAHALNLSFVSSSAYSVSGTIAGAGGPGATVRLTGAATQTATANSSGSFAFQGLVNGNYTVAVTNTGFVFTPASQAVTISGANAALSFSSAAQTFSLTGTITGPGGSGAVLSLTGAAKASTTANASGAFSFSGLANGTYTLAVTNAGFLFTPATQSVTINGANASASFASVQTFTLSGTISGAGGNGATVSVSGSSSASVVANASGVYTFAALPAGTYTVTPSRSGFSYTPASRSVTLSANATANFTTVTYSITGTISGTGGSGATISLTGAATATVTANASGVYSLTSLPPGSYVLTPSKGSTYAFTPASQSITITNANVTANFTSKTLYNISGTINGPGGAGATVKLSGAGSASVIANSSGVYSFVGFAAGSYTITPSKTGYVYTPASQSVTLSTANATANFSSAVQTFTLTGTVTGTGSSGATIRLSGPSSATTTTNSSGAYSFSGLTNGTYTVAASKTGFVYTPASQSVSINAANASANFTSVTKTYIITGTISGAGGSGATVKLSGAATATVTANSSGVYTFTGLLSGFYMVTPSKSGRTFSPSLQATMISSSDVTGLNFSSR